MLESQQRNLLARPADASCCELDVDAGGVQSRRVLERLVAEERNDLLKA